MVQYDYTKSPVDLNGLTYEINTNSVISGTLDHIDFNEPNNLSIYFVDNLSSQDKAELDSIVSIHTGIYNPPTSYDLDHYLDSHADVVDSYTGISGTYWLMELLGHRRELYNDEENPLYLEGHEPILGASGILQQHADDINAVTTAMSKNGWYTQYIKNWTYPSPMDLLIYYGWLNSFNYGTNSWNNEKVAQDMAKYNYLIFGDGIQTPSHGDYSNTQIIIPRIKELNQNVKIFGYVSANQSLSNFKDKVDDWDDLEIDGIFIDEAGYDYGKTRAEFNERVDYIHNKTYANICFVNSWNLNHVLGVENDPNYPNSTYNTISGSSNLTENDWCLLESFPINTTVYTSTNGYESKSDWKSRGEVAIGKKYIHNINLAGVGVINNNNTNAQDLFNFGFISAMMWNLDAYGTSDTGYGSSSATVEYWDRPKTEGLGREWNIYPSVQLDLNDGDKYHRYLDFGKLTLDFSTSAQTVNIEKFTPLNTFKIEFSAGDLTEGTSAYPIKTTSSGSPITGLGYDDTIEGSMYSVFEIPSNWMCGTDVSVKIYFFNDYSQTGIKVCRWAVDYQIYSDLDELSSKTTTTLTINKSLPNDANADTFLKAEITMPYNDSNNPLVRNGTVMFRIYRDCTDAADTMSNDAILVLLVFEFNMEVI